VDDLTDAAARLRAGTTSAAALADESLAAIEANVQLNAFISVDASAARAAARRADEELAAGRDRGLLHGMPLSIKTSSMRPGA
jgi:aspartyl-tRNA(Asn)/glutamyl-tRNA(Gln) amidotransferase subunit A